MYLKDVSKLFRSCVTAFSISSIVPIQQVCRLSTLSTDYQLCRLSTLLPVCTGPQTFLPFVIICRHTCRHIFCQQQTKVQFVAIFAVSTDSADCLCIKLHNCKCFPNHFIYLLLLPASVHQSVVYKKHDQRHFNTRMQQSTKVLYIKGSKGKGSEFIQCLYCSTSYSRRSGTDHSVTCKLHRTCLYLVSIHQMAPPQTEVAHI